jgi:Family of unknown function (DUF5681)
MPNPQNIIPPKKGEVRNPNGRPKGSLNSKTVLQKYLALTEKVKNPVTGEFENMNQLEIMMLSVIKNGRKGDLRAVRELLDRLEGKAQQNVDMTSMGQQLEPMVIYRPAKLEDTDI